MLRVYLAQAMTGRDMVEVVREAEDAVWEFAKVGISTWSPTLEERVPKIHAPLTNTKVTLAEKWPVDKKFLRQCFVVCNLSGDLKSFGVEDEHAIQRSYWKPTVLVSPRHAAGYMSIANMERDLVVGTAREAALLIKATWGTHAKRLMWNLKMDLKAPKWLYRQFERHIQ
jgi:hypothetical protein